MTDLEMLSRAPTPHEENVPVGTRRFPPSRTRIRLKSSPRSRTIFRAAALLLGAGAVALGFYGASGRLTTTDGHRGITSMLPRASSNGPDAPSLAPPNLLRPLSPEEAAKENADRPFVNRPDSAAGKFVLKTDAEDRDRALNCLAQAVYYEAASEGPDGGRAVAQVVLNRMHHPGYPSSVCGVVYEGADRTTGCQFTFTCDGSLLRVPVASLWARSRKIAEEALAGKVFAPIGHATHYHADYVLPYWADSLDKTVQIGRHIFYRLRSSLGDSRAFSQRYAGAEPQLPVPASPIVIPPQAVTQELANALLSDGTPGLPKDVEKASPTSNSTLLIDSSKGTLLADAGATEAAAKKGKAAVECISSERKKLSPLAANDVRAGSTSSTC